MQSEATTGPLDAFVPIEGSNLYRWDHERYLRSMTPAQRRNHDRKFKVYDLQWRIYKMCPWLRGPLLGYVTDFWTSLLDEGPYQTMKPRWGMVTFAYLNDGIKPSVWHTYQQVMHPGGEYEAIWPHGAPRSKAEADQTR